MNDFFKKHTLITGTLLLTATGFAARILGFFYRVFLSRTIGAEGLGIFNMVHPIYGICFALCAGSLQTAISRFVAADLRKGKEIFKTGLVISMAISTGLSALIIRFSAPLAHYVLMEDRCACLLPFMAISVPFSAVHACINGYYYGIQKTRVPAMSQIVEQIIRMAGVFLIADILTESDRKITVQLAVTGHLLGELAACLFSVFCFCFFAPALACEASGAPRTSSSPFTVKPRRPAGGKDPELSNVSPGPSRGAGCPLPGAQRVTAFFRTASPLMSLALPLMGNRLVLNILSGAEAIWIPKSLGAFGLTSQEAVAVYGVLTGMAMPAGVK